MIKSFTKYILTLVALLCITTNAWALRYAKAIAKSSPTQGGWVWVTKTDGNAPSTWDRTEDSSEDDNLKTSNYTFPFYYFAKPQAGYEFKGWATASNTNTLSSTVQTNWYVGVTATSNNNVSWKPATATYYAIFAKLTTNVSSLSFEKNVDEGWGTEKSLVATYVHAGDVIAKISGEHEGDFSFSNSSLINQKTIASNNTDVESSQTIYIYFNPSNSGNRTATLTFSGNGMTKTVILNGKGIKLNQTLSWNNESAIETNMQLGRMQTVTATATSGLAVTYSSSDDKVLTVDATGKITAVGLGTAIITASQAGNYKYNAAPSITKTFTVWNKNTPIFTPNGFNEDNICHLKVGDKVTLEVLNVSDSLSGDFKVNTDNNILGITRNGNTITIEALNAGTTSAIFTQSENSGIFGAEKKYQFSVTKINNTLAIASSSYSKYVDEEITNIISSVNSDAAVTTSSSDATIAYYDVTSNKILIPNSEAKSFSSQAITITIAQAETYKYTAAEKTITLTVNKYALSAEIKKDNALWNELINNAFSVSYGLQDYTVTSLNTDIAQYISGNKIQTYFTSGTAQFRIFRPEDRKYKEFNQTLELIVQAAGGCDVLNATEEVSLEYSVLWKERIYEPTSFTGIPNELTFYTYKTAGIAVGDIEVQQYVNNKWIAVKDHSNNDVKIDATTSYKKYGPYTLDESATKMRFYNGYGSYKRYFKNVQVTRKTYLRPSETEIALPQTNRNKSSEKTFDLSWSTCFDNIRLVSNNDLFEVGTTQINSTAHTGTTNNILVRFKGANEPGTYSAVITIYDQSQSKEVHVSCEVKEKLQTRIEYSGEYLYAEVNECLNGLFSVIDENGNTVEGAEIQLTSSHEGILDICGNNSFLPHCGGQVTLTANYEGDDTYAAALEWSKVITVENCYQTIVWELDFRGYIADANGTINKSTPLTAYADPTHFTITYELDDAAQKFARIENGSLIIFGIGTGHIIASAPSGIYQNKQFDETSLMHEIRVRKWGDKCNTDEMVVTAEVTLSQVLVWLPTEREFELDGRPYARMEFYSHVSNESLNNDLTISFSTDGGSNWTNEKTFHDIPKKYNWSTPYVHDNIPEGANRVKFRTNSTTNTYFNMVKLVQKTYLEPNVNEIHIEDAVVNKQFQREFKVKYSDIPLLQYAVSDSHNLGLKLTPSPETHNDCSDWGEYTFTLTGTSPYPQENVQENITLYTSAGHQITIPVIITAKVSEEVYYYTQKAGNWSELTNWTINNDQTPATELPTAANPVVLSQAVTIDNSVDATAYSVTMRDGGSLTVMPTGGLTVHAGGFIEANKQNITLHNMQSGAGYIRISPYFTGTMPKIKVLYQTKSTLDYGANKDATWQYIGAPGENCSIYVDHNTWLYLMDEKTKDGWVLQDRNASVALQPFAGYAITQYGQPTYEWTAQLTNANYELPLTYTKGGRSGRHIFANSYTAPIDIKALDGQITGDENRFRIEKTIYIFNSGSWNQWNEYSQTGDGTPGQYYAIPISAAAKGYIPEQTVIPPMQGFYMRVRSKTALDQLKTTEEVGTIVLDYNQLIMGDGHSNMHTPMRTPQRFDPINNAAFKRIRIHATSANSGADRLYVIQDTICTSKYDNGYDATNQATSGLVNIYTNESAGKMEVSCSNNMDSIYIGFMAGEDSQYTLHFGAECGNIYLKDLENDSIFRMQEGEPYHFTAVPNSTNDLRFQILLYPLLDYQRPEIGEEDKLVTNVTDIPMAQIWSDGNYIYIANAPIDSTVRVYNISGYLLSTIALDQMPYTLDLSHLTAGVYMIQVNNQVYKFICK